MKIYFIGQKGIPSKSGGVEKHVEELSIRLAEMGHEVFVYARPHYTRKGIKKYKGVNIIHLPSIATKHLDAISHTFRACINASKRDADIIHFHSIGPSSLIWLVKLLKPGIPVVSTFHTRCYLHKKWGFIARAYLKMGELAACFLADRTITISLSLKKYVFEKYGRNADYIPNGVSLLKKVPAKEITKWGLKKEEYIVSISRLIRHKGVHYLIDAYKKLKTKKKLVIVGGGMFTDDYVKELKKLASSNKNIIFTGPQSGRVLKELFSNAYLFVQPSESEGLSIALLEAMSFKRPVLVSDIPENVEAIEDSGITFKSGDREDLKDKLSFILKRPSLARKKGEEGYLRVKALYDWKSIAASIIEVYRIVLAEKGEEKIVRKESMVKKFISFLF